MVFDWGMADAFDGFRIGAGYAVVEPDRHRPGSFTLVVDGTPQSHVDLEDPTHLAFEYIRRIGHAIDLLPPGPITALHLGAGALTLPRYVAVTRPGSRQQVVELERDLVEHVREVLPFPRGASIRVRYGDAREVLGKLPNGLRGTVDLAVVDVFGGSQIPAHVTSVEFYRSVAEFLSPTGIVAVNVADGAGLAFARGRRRRCSPCCPRSRRSRTPACSRAAASATSCCSARRRTCPWRHAAAVLLGPDAGQGRARCGTAGVHRRGADRHRPDGRRVTGAEPQRLRGLIHASRPAPDLTTSRSGGAGRARHRAWRP